jgi:hypothetical protein
LALHGKPVAGFDSISEHRNCVADGFRFYGWLYRSLALVLIAFAGYAAASGLAGWYWLGFLIAGAVCLWNAAGLAFAGASALPQAVGDGLLKLVVFLFFIGLFLASTLMAVSVQARAVELLPDFANVALTMLLLLFGVGSYFIEVVALLTALNRNNEHWSRAGKPLKRLVVALAAPNTALKCGVNERRRGVAYPNVVCFDLEPIESDAK